MTNHILPETLADLYAQAGVTPGRSWSYNPDTQSCCGLGVAYYASTGCDSFPPESLDVICERLNISPSYGMGYWEGFDGNPMDPDRDDDLEYTEGYRHGFFGWHSVKHLAPADVDEDQ